MSPSLTNSADAQEEASVAVLVVAGFRLVGPTLAGEPLRRAGTSARAVSVIEVDVGRRLGLLSGGHVSALRGVGVGESRGGEVIVSPYRQ